MVRDLRRLANTRFDVIIVGAGFYGAAAAWDAAQRGLSVAIVDKGDFGSGTSFNNLKTLHGGLRSLQSLDFKQMRLFIRERRALARIAPHLVEPLQFVVPTYRDPRRSAMLMRLALLINDVVSRDRHEGLDDPSLHLPGGRVVSRQECFDLNPVIDRRGVTGGAVWHDYQLQNTDRMTLSFLLSAADAGAATANYVRAAGFLRDGTRVVGVKVENTLTSERFDVRGQTVVNAAGPWAASLLETLDQTAVVPAPKLSRAMNLVTRPVVGAHACGGLADGRFLFLVPWRDVSILGTSHDAHQDTAVTRWDLEAFLKDAREAFPIAGLTSGDVRLVHRGLLPMVSGQDTQVTLLRESVVVDHRAHGVPGLVSMFGVRYTTARHTAARAIDAVFRGKGYDMPPICRTAETPLAGGEIGDKAHFLRTVTQEQASGASADALRRLAINYGTRYGAVLGIARQQPALASPLGQECRVTGAEIVHAIREEAAMRLSDALIRRTEAGSAGHPGADAVEQAAAIMAAEMGWDETRTRQEVSDVEAFYRLPA